MIYSPTLIIAGVPIPFVVYPDSQTYRRIEAATVHRMLNGAAQKTTHWEKLATTISGNGWAPPALAGVDWSVPVEIACVAPRSQHSATTAATLPAARRSDLDTNVYAFAVVDGEIIETPLASLVGNVATATAVTGADAYAFYYYPLITCVSPGVDESLDLSGAVYAWSVSAEQV